MPDTITVYKAKDGWRWHKQAEGNNKLIAESGEAYEDKGFAEVAAVREAKGTDAMVKVEEPEPK